MVLFVGAIFSGGAFVTRALQDHSTWQDRIDESCVAGYGLMIEAEQKSPLSVKLNEEAKAEQDAISLLNHENVPVSVLLGVNDYIHAKEAILVIRQRIASRGAVTPALRAKLTHAQSVAQAIAEYTDVGEQLHVCGREASHLE